MVADVLANVACLMIGLYLAFYIYGVASIVDPELSPEDQRDPITRKILFTGAIIPFLLGTSLVALSFFNLFKMASRSAIRRKKNQ